MEHEGAGLGCCECHLVVDLAGGSDGRGWVEVHDLMTLSCCSGRECIANDLQLWL